MKLVTRTAVERVYERTYKAIDGTVFKTEDIRNDCELIMERPVRKIIKKYSMDFDKFIELADHYILSEEAYDVEPHG